MTSLDNKFYSRILPTKLSILSQMTEEHHSLSWINKSLHKEERPHLIDLQGICEKLWTHYLRSESSHKTVWLHLHDFFQQATHILHYGLSASSSGLGQELEKATGHSHHSAEGHNKETDLIRACAKKLHNFIAKHAGQDHPWGKTKVSFEIRSVSL